MTDNEQRTLIAALERIAELADWRADGPGGSPAFRLGQIQEVCRAAAPGNPVIEAAANGFLALLTAARPVQDDLTDLDWAGVEEEHMKSMEVLTVAEPHGHWKLEVPAGASEDQITEAATAKLATVDPCDYDEGWRPGYHLPTFTSREAPVPVLRGDAMVATLGEIEIGSAAVAYQKTGDAKVCLFNGAPIAWDCGAGWARSLDEARSWRTAAEEEIAAWKRGLSGRNGFVAALETAPMPTDG